MTVEEVYPLYQLLKKDNRYPLDAYVFVREALSFASEVLELGQDSISESSTTVDSDGEFERERHLTGQELCIALRKFATHQFGYLAATVLSDWGIKSTSDFGEIVYNMIAIGLMKKSKNDDRSHFDDVFDFESAFHQDFRFEKCKIEMH